MVRYPAPVPPGFSPRGCKGRSPLHEITLILPLPAGKGVGGMGARNKTKGKVGGREKSKPPQQIPERQRQPATSRASPPPAPPTPAEPAARKGSHPPGAWFATLLRRRPGLRPLLPSPIKTARNHRPQSGRGRSRPARSGSSGNADYISIPMFLFSASSSEQRQQRQRSAEPQRHLRR